VLLFHHVIGPAVHLPPAMSIPVAKLIAASSEAFFDQHQNPQKKSTGFSEL